MPKKNSEQGVRLSHILIFSGIVPMIAIAGTALLLATIQVVPIQFSRISLLGAALIGVGAVIFLAGIGLYSKGK